MGVEIKILEDKDTIVKLNIVAEKENKKWESHSFWQQKKEGDTAESIVADFENKIDKYYKAW